MKAFLSIVFVLMIFQLSAQNYRTANTTQTTYYEQTIDWSIKNVPFKVDNFTIKNDGDTLVYFLEIFDENVWYDISTYPFSCLDTASTPWQGKKALLKPDGRDIYYNENNEAITINTQANINDSWLLFENDSLRVMATSTTINSQSIFGVTDNVKQFSLQVFDSLNNPISHPLNSEFFQISQNYGFVIAPDFYHFPSAEKHNLKGVQLPKLGIYNITRNDIYNFDVGDEFHIKDGSWLQNHYYKVIIIGKKIDANGDWEYEYDVVYHLYVENDINTGETIITQDTSGNVPYTLIPTNYNFQETTPMTFRSSPLGYVGGYAVIDSSIYYGRIQNTHMNPYWLVDGTNCWEYVLTTGPVPSTYIEGLGGAYGGYSSILWSATNLIYYKKGNEIYGTPINFNQILPTKKFIIENQNLKIYPNPAQYFLTIEIKILTNSDFNILIINNLGQIIEQDILNQNMQQIDISNLPKGIYTLQIRNEEMVFVKRFVKE
jgi:hypothetical protein